MVSKDTRTGILRFIGPKPPFPTNVHTPRARHPGWAERGDVWRTENGRFGVLRGPNFTFRQFAPQVAWKIL